MNPIFQAMIITTLFGRKRTCPICKRNQFVSVKKRLENVPCKFCGADLPLHK